MSLSVSPASTAIPMPVVVPATRVLILLGVTVFLALAVYYFIGVDQGATSVFGSNAMGVHEFVHDARHFLAFPCH